MVMKVETKRYFLDRKGAQTFRMKGKPGERHIGIAATVLAEQGISPADAPDYYDQMFRLGFARVAETDKQVEVECPKTLTTAQRRFLEAKEQEGKTLTLNDPKFMATKNE